MPEFVDKENNDKALLTTDVPVGSRMAQELNLNYGNIDIIEASGENFIWGISMWGISRIGGNSTTNV